MAQARSSGPRERGDHPLTDKHLAALLGAADADLLAVISILALSGMRFDELRRLRVAQCGRGAFRVGECAGDADRDLHGTPPRRRTGAADASTPPPGVALRHRIGDLGEGHGQQRGNEGVHVLSTEDLDALGAEVEKVVARIAAARGQGRG